MIDEPAVLEKAVDRCGRDAADAENGAEEVRARTEMLLGAQKLDRGALLLQRVVRRGDTFDGNALSGKLEWLLRLGRELQRALADKGGAHVLSCDLVVVFQCFAAHHHLEVAKAASVVQGDEAEVLHIAHRADPTRHGDFLAPERVDVGEQLGDFRALHHSPSHDMRKGAERETPDPCNDEPVVVLLFFERSLGRSEAGDRHAVRRAADVIEADLVERVDGIRVATVFAADAAD